MPKKTYLIGTRGSLLATTQCQQVKQQLEDLTGDQFELKIIKTRGDEQTDKALWQLDGKDFFTRELDHALLDGEVDLVVHSYKDLGSVRPDGIKLAAITQRKFGNDILLMPQSTIEKLKEKTEVVIGTSSPRRIVNLEKSLPAYLPAGIHGKEQPLRVVTKLLRGNINTRIEKLRDGHYDGIVLAFAGLERLAMDPEASKVLKELLDGMNFMILPQSRFPWAASQGALALELAEARSDDGELAKKLNLLHHDKTAEAVAVEREAFATYGGGCHLAVGIAAELIADVGILTSHQGRVDHREVDSHIMVRTQPLSKIKLSAQDKIFLGTASNTMNAARFLHDEWIEKKPVKVNLTADLKAHYFLSHPHTAEAIKQNKMSAGCFLWAAGEKTHKKAARFGLWVNTHADGLGENSLDKWLDSALLKLLGADRQIPWTSLTHKKGISALGEIAEGYERVPKTITISDEFKANLEKAKVFYWTSYSQFQDYLPLLQNEKERHHFCGIGKTWQRLKQAGVAVTAVTGMQEFLELIDYQEN